MSGEFPPAIEALAQSLGRLPGVGKRTAERLALALLAWDPADLQDLGQQLSTLQARIHPCVECGNLAEAERCRFCLDPRRDTQLICVVEQARQVPVIEKSGRFRGLYHVLGGRLSPLDGIQGKDLNIPSLLRRVEQLAIRELIIATSPDVEGEATAAYLAEEIHARFPVAITRIALGVPVGADLNFADAATMAMALDSRRKL